MSDRLESRHLGEVRLDGGVFDTTVPFRRGPVPLRLEIDHPERFDDVVVGNVDLALDGLESLDSMARRTIADGVRLEGSAASRLRARQPGELSTEEFVEALELRRMTILPDGGRQSADRVTMTYGMPGDPPLESVTVRFLERIGPQLDSSAR